MSTGYFLNSHFGVVIGEGGERQAFSCVEFLYVCSWLLFMQQDPRVANSIL
jgi:hypothetical protein